MRPFDVPHHDPRPLARAAAVRSARELDPHTREDGRRMSMSERLAVGFKLSSWASRVQVVKRGR